jgi:hypothetical protein
MGVGLALLPGLVGCTTPNRARAPVPRQAVLNVPLGTVGVIATSTVPWFGCHYPRPRGRTEDAEKWAEKGFFLGADRRSWQSVNLGPSGAFVGATMLAGGILGRLAGDVHDSINAVTGVPKERLAAADASMARFLTEVHFQEILRARVGAEARRRTSIPVTVVKKPFPEGQEKELSKFDCVMAGTLAWLPPGQTPHDYLAEQAIDTVLEIRIVEHGLQGKSGANPNLRLVADVEARLIKFQNGVELYHRQMIHRSTARKFTDWTADDARALRVEIETCCQLLARQIVEGLLPAAEDPLSRGDSLFAGGFKTGSREHARDGN